MTRRGPAMAAVAGVAVILLMVVVLILPKATQIRKEQQAVEAAMQGEALLQVQLQQLRADARDARKTRQELAVFDTQIPSAADLPGLIKTLSAGAADASLDFLSLAPAQPTTTAAGDLSIVPVQVTMVGGFFAIDEYLFELESLPRVSQVTSISLTAGPAGLPQLQVVASAQFYTTDLSAGPGSVPAETTLNPAAGTTTVPSPGVPPASPGASS